MVNCMCQLDDSGMPEWLGRRYFRVCLSVFPRGWAKSISSPGGWAAAWGRSEQNRKAGEGRGSWLCCSGGGAPALGLWTRVGMDATGPQASGCREHTVAFSLHGP